MLCAVTSVINNQTKQMLSLVMCSIDENDERERMKFLCKCFAGFLLYSMLSQNNSRHVFIYACAYV